MNSKLNIVGKYKIWTVITLCILVVGIVIFGVLGFNKTIDYKGAYEVDVKIFSLKVSEEKKTEDVAKDVADDFFDEFGYKSFTLTQDEDGFAILKYTFKNDVQFDASALKDSIKTALSNNQITLEVEDVSEYQVEKTFFSNVGYISLALGVGLVAILVYLFFIEKLASALSVVISGVISALLFISIIAISSVPVGPSVWTMVIATALICVSLSAGLTSRFREESKNSANEKLSNKDIANIAVDASILRYIVITAFLVVSSVLLIAVGKGDYRMIGYLLLDASIVAIFSSIVWTPIMWCLIKKDKKSYKSQAKVS